ncbi:serine hydrolase domain-containing protein [Falsiroseomonas ponticola]|uniref:serine hydrolase domain-containing protein n=1 Tax=Falsiroseomonas ponticola TaxID=2786951 RepID=UPI001933DF54|nr:serine hydrolase [Roseomonas ponticola]
MIRPTRRATLAAGALTLLGAPSLAQTPAIPGTNWARHARPEDAGFRSDGLAEVERMTKDLTTTSLMVVRGGRIAWSLGDIAEVSYLASARKSILSMLYGRYVADGTIDLDRSIGEIGIDDVQTLLPIERTAKIRHLLTATSGVYHPQGSPGGSTTGVPARGSREPGTYFYYNNWDFNVCGTVFEKLTGKSVFAALTSDLAGPLGLEDYDASRQRMLGFPDQSRHLAYHLFLSGRDMARLGLVMARGGRWGDRQVIPADWVRESTKLRIPAANLTEGFKDGPLGYGYLWWVPETRTGAAWRNAALANGNYGQFILVMPETDTVIVHRRAVTDAFAIGRNMGTDNSNPRGVTSGEFLRLADAIVAAGA